MSKPEAYCDCTGSPPWPPMMRLHAGTPNRYYLCRVCGAIREDVYRKGAIVTTHWYDEPNGQIPQTVKREAIAVLSMPRGEQLPLWED